MLHLVDRNKAGRNLKDGLDNAVDWRTLFKASEDSFTSCVFGLLSYLPADQTWLVLTEGLYKITDVVPSPSIIEAISFWPRWKKRNGGHCEPDVFIKFDTFYLIVEAKRWDFDQQEEVQWRTQIETFYLENPDCDKPLMLLAIGGNASNLNVSNIFCGDIVVPVLKLKWRRLLEAILRRSRTLNRNSHQHIYNDLILAFRVHGFQTGALFESMPNHIQINLSNLNIGFNNLKVRNRFQKLPNIKIERYNELIKIL